jgi:hypothetical protein
MTCVVNGYSTTTKPLVPSKLGVGYKWNTQEPKNRDKNKGEKEGRDRNQKLKHKKGKKKGKG